MQKTLLIIGAGLESIEGIEVARELGLRLVIVDGDVNAPGLDMADLKIIKSTYNFNGILNELEKLLKQGVNVNGVIAMCADVPITVAKIAQALDIPGLSLETAKLVADKIEMKKRLKAMHIPIPDFADVSNKVELSETAKKFGFPVILKPADSRGSRGVQIVDAMDQLETAWSVARKNSPTKRVIIEEFLQGPQVSTETICNDGDYYTLGFADRNYEWLEKTKPFIIENGGDTPTGLQENQKKQLVKLAERAAEALGITHGIAKGDLVYTKDGPKVIEIAGRLSGGYFSSVQIPLATGVNLIEKAIKIALGQKLSSSELKPTKEQAVAIRYLDLSPGVIQSVEGVEQAQSLPGVKLLKIFIAPDEVIPELTDHTKRSGFVITIGATKNEAIERAKSTLNSLIFTYRSIRS